MNGFLKHYLTKEFPILILQLIVFNLIFSILGLIELYILSSFIENSDFFNIFNELNIFEILFASSSFFFSSIVIPLLLLFSIIGLIISLVNVIPFKKNNNLSFDGT